jgi:hypothetical protein
MTICRLRLISILLVLSAPGLTAQPDATFNRDFDHADRRARTMVVQLQCAQHMAGLRARGAFGAADTLGTTGLCIRSGDAYVGVYLSLDSAGARHRRFSAVQLTNNAPNTTPLDTAALVSAARARRETLGLGASAMGRPFAPFILHGDADTVEVWLVPLSVITGSPPSSGGERGYVYAGYGARLVTTIEATTKFDTLQVRPGAPLSIRRTDSRLPLFSDLLVANLQQLRGRAVEIELAGVTSRLMDGPGGGVWLHAKRTAP